MKDMGKSVSSEPRPLEWRHYELDCASNHRRRNCFFNLFFRRRSKKTSNIGVTGLCEGNHRRPVNSPHKGPVKQKMSPFDDVIMTYHKPDKARDVCLVYWMCCIMWLVCHKQYCDKDLLLFQISGGILIFEIFTQFKVIHTLILIQANF